MSTRHFFDVHTPAIGTHYDYTGRRCKDEADANHMGQLVALDLGTTDPALWAGATVKVRNVFRQRVVLDPGAGAGSRRRVVCR